MAEAPGAYTLLPWVRQGITAARLPVDTLAPDLAARVTLPVDLHLDADTVGVKARLYGPGDVIGIDQRQVVRTDPGPRTPSAEPSYLAAVEFARPDFPWLFTPASADPQARLRPWICLVVVRRQAGVRIFAEQTRPLPTLEIAAPASIAAELQDLTESWAWAHGQALGAAAVVDDTLANRSPQTRSRLLCPRKLEPDTAYIACVVPTFDIGSKAGLGRTITADDEKALLPAWRVEDTTLSTLELPVYYSWEFSTGPGGDFKSLVEKLVARDLPASIGIRPMDVTNADPDLPRIPSTSPDATLGLEGALMSRQTQPKGFANGVGPAFRQALRTRLAPPAAGSSDPLVAPPIYGARHANQSALPADNLAPHWLRELNLDPRYRAVAAYGTAVVQARQEELMASAWEQVGEIERANQILRQAQLLRAANQAVLRNRLRRLPDSAALQITRSVHARLLNAPAVTFQSSMAFNQASAPVSPAFRRIARPRGPVIRRALPPALRIVRPVVQQLAIGTIAAFIMPPAGQAITVDAVQSRYLFANGAPNGEITTAEILSGDLASVPPRPGFQVVPPELPGMPAPSTFPIFVIAGSPDNEAARNFRAAAIAHQALLQPTPEPIFSSFLQPDQLKTSMLAQIEPSATVGARVRSLVTFPGPRDTRDELEPIMAAPEFPTPMYEALRDLSQELLLPGLGTVPDNTVALLLPNPRFIEAYMVGLNHEFARELLWRDYPTDQRGTYFRQFWDTRARAPAGSAPDIQPLHLWSPAARLGQNLPASSVGQLVLLIRGELVRRYPNAIVYAVRAAPPASSPVLGTQELLPLFQGSLAPDVLFFGFSLTSAAARGNKTTDPGWFFVIQQPPTEPRFGLAVGVQTPGVFLHPQGHAAATARALARRPVRVAIHASALIR